MNFGRRMVEQERSRDITLRLAEAPQVAEVIHEEVDDALAQIVRNKFGIRGISMSDVALVQEYKEIEIAIDRTVDEARRVFEAMEEEANVFKEEIRQQGIALTARAEREKAIMEAYRTEMAALRARVKERVDSKSAQGDDAAVADQR